MHHFSTPPTIERFALLIGAMKGGTTTLFKHLARHPAIAACREKEPAFFTRREKRERGRLYYESLWDFDPARHGIAMEGSTEYTKLPSTPSAAYFIQRFGCDFRFLYLVRDPIERIRSQYRHGLSHGFIENPIHVELKPDVVATSNYAMQLWPYVHAFGRERILVLHQRELIDEPADTLRRVCTFLGVDPSWTFAPMPPQNTSRAFDRRCIARLLDSRGALPSIVSPERLADLDDAEFEELARNWAAESGRPSAFAECVREHRRATTPTQEQVEEIRSLLAPQLEAFRDEWGVDPWSPENRAAIDAGARVRIGAA